MADPRVIGPQQRKANLSKLMEARNAASQGEKVNFCPFGCDLGDLDENWYCHHLVGFTQHPDPRIATIEDPPRKGLMMEPMITDRRGRRIVQAFRLEPRVKKVKVKGKEEEKRVFVKVKNLQPVEEKDKLVRVTTSWRVYRDGVPKPEIEEALEEILEEV